MILQRERNKMHIRGNNPNKHVKRSIQKKTFNNTKEYTKCIPREIQKQTKHGYQTKFSPSYVAMALDLLEHWKKKSTGVQNDA